MKKKSEKRFISTQFSVRSRNDHLRFFDNKYKESAGIKLKFFFTGNIWIETKDEHKAHDFIYRDGVRSENLSGQVVMRHILPKSGWT